jgi:AcrR family transcriptional regulator
VRSFLDRVLGLIGKIASGMVRKKSVKTLNNTRRENILRAAQEVFFEKSYGGTSMSMIAARVGGSKGTLYNYFTSKKELFAAQVRATCNSTADRIFDSSAAHETDPMIALSRVGVQYLECLYSANNIRMLQILISEAQRYPEFARIFYDAGPARDKDALTHLLNEFKRNDSLNIADCTHAAEQFLCLCKGPTYLQFLLDLVPPQSPQTIRSQVTQAVNAFVALYGPVKKTASS